MKTYFIRRALLTVPTFFGLTLLVFTITRFVPGGPVDRILRQSYAQNFQEGGLGQGSEIKKLSLDETQINELKKYFELDIPIHLAYLKWLGKLFQGDFGYSTRFHEPVWDMIEKRLPISIYFGILTTILSYLVCVPLGVFKAIKHYSVFDHVSSMVVFIGYAIPHYVVGIFLLSFFASQLDWFPMEGFTSDQFEQLNFFQKIWDILHHSFLPLLAYVAGSFAVMTFMMKNSLMDHLAADYVRTAMAKGLSFKDAVIKHALRNSLIPLATHFGNNISLILTGSFLIETIFNIDGIGLLGFESVRENDYPVVMATLVISSLLYMIGNILSDICVALVDPRVKFQ